jgi:hypothetical protein
MKGVVKNAWSQTWPLLLPVGPSFRMKADLLQSLACFHLDPVGPTDVLNGIQNGFAWEGVDSCANEACERVNVPAKP